MESAIAENITARPSSGPPQIARFPFGAENRFRSRTDWNIGGFSNTEKRGHCAAVPVHWPPAAFIALKQREALRHGTVALSLGGRGP